MILYPEVLIMSDMYQVGPLQIESATHILLVPSLPIHFNNTFKILDYGTTPHQFDVDVYFKFSHNRSKIKTISIFTSFSEQIIVFLGSK